MLTGYTQLQAKLHAISSPAATKGIMQLLGLSAIREQKLLVRRKTGTTGRTIHLAEVTATTALTVAGGAGIYLEQGTRPHLITPNAAKALRWASSSSMGFRLSGKPSSAKGNSIGWAFAKVVHHPGTRPYPFMLPGAELAVQKAGLDPIVGAWNAA